MTWTEEEFQSRREQDMADLARIGLAEAMPEAQMEWISKEEAERIEALLKDLLAAIYDVMSARGSENVTPSGTIILTAGIVRAFAVAWAKVFAYQGGPPADYLMSVAATVSAMLSVEALRMSKGAVDGDAA